MAVQNAGHDMQVWSEAGGGKRLCVDGHPGTTVHERNDQYKSRIQMRMHDGIEPNGLQKKIFNIVHEGNPITFPFAPSNMEPPPGLSWDQLSVMHKSGYLQAMAGAGKTVCFLYDLLRVYRHFVQDLVARGIKKPKINSNETEVTFQPEHFFDIDGQVIEQGMFIGMGTSSRERIRESFNLRIDHRAYKAVYKAMKRAGGTLPLEMRKSFGWKSAQTQSFLKDCLYHGWVLQNGKIVDLGNILYDCMHNDLKVLAGNWTEELEYAGKATTLLYVIKSNIAFEGLMKWRLTEGNSTRSPIFSVEGYESLSKLKKARLTTQPLASVLVIDEAQQGESREGGQWSRAKSMMKRICLSVRESSATLGRHPKHIQENYHRNVLASTDPLGCKAELSQADMQLPRELWTYSGTGNDVLFWFDFRMIKKKWKSWTRDNPRHTGPRGSRKKRRCKRKFVQVMLICEDVAEIRRFQQYVTKRLQSSDPNKRGSDLANLRDQVWISTKTNEDSQVYENNMWVVKDPAEQKESFSKSGFASKGDPVIRIQASVKMDNESADYPNVRYVGAHRNVGKLETLIQIFGRIRPYLPAVSTFSPTCIVVVPSPDVIANACTATKLYGYNIERHDKMRFDLEVCDTCCTHYLQDKGHSCGIEWRGDQEYVYDNFEAEPPQVSRSINGSRSTDEVETLSSEGSHMQTQEETNDSSFSGDEEDTDISSDSMETSAIMEARRGLKQLSNLAATFVEKKDYRQLSKKSTESYSSDEFIYSDDGDYSSQDESSASDSFQVVKRKPLTFNLRSRNSSWQYAQDVSLTTLFSNIGTVLTKSGNDGLYRDIDASQSHNDIIYKIDPSYVCTKHGNKQFVCFYTDYRRIRLPRKKDGIEPIVNVISQDGSGISQILEVNKDLVCLHSDRYVAQEYNRGDETRYDIVRRFNDTGCLMCRIKNANPDEVGVIKAGNKIRCEDENVVLTWLGKDTVVRENSSLCDAFYEHEKQLLKVFNKTSSCYNFNLVASKRDDFRGFDCMYFVGSKIRRLKVPNVEPVYFFPSVNELIHNCKIGVKIKKDEIFDTDLIIKTNRNGITQYCGESEAEEEVMGILPDDAENIETPVFSPKIQEIAARKRSNSPIALAGKRRRKKSTLVKTGTTQRRKVGSKKAKRQNVSESRPEAPRNNVQVMVFDKVEECKKLYDEYLEYQGPKKELLCEKSCKHDNKEKEVWFCRLANLQQTMHPGIWKTGKTHINEKYLAKTKLKRFFMFRDKQLPLPDFIKAGNEERDTAFESWVEKQTITFDDYEKDNTDLAPIHMATEYGISVHDMYILSTENEWLTSPIIDCWCDLLNDTVASDEAFCFGPTFSNNHDYVEAKNRSKLPTLLQERYTELNQRLQKEHCPNVFGKQRLVFVLQIRNNHWICVWYDTILRTIFIANSSENQDLTNVKDLIILCETIDYCQRKELSREKIRGAEIIKTEYLNLQTNGHDCGVFACAFAMLVVSRKSLRNIGMDNIVKMRKKIKEAIFTGKIEI